MSILELNRRQRVVFDPANSDHRRAYQQFLTDRSWGYVNERFILDSLSLDLKSMCERELTAYYLSQEFSGTKRGRK